MRTIKFRGLGSNGWEYGYLVREQFTGYDSTNYFQCDNARYLEYEARGYGDEAIKYGYRIYRSGNQSRVWVQRETVGQFTGLLDKNGKEIYEGDITKSPNADNALAVEYQEIMLSDDATAPGMGFQFNAEASDMEVIGNIHENPDLCK